MATGTAWRNHRRKSARQFGIAAEQFLQAVIAALGLEDAVAVDVAGLTDATIDRTGDAVGGLRNGRASARSARVKKVLKLVKAHARICTARQGDIETAA